MNYLVDGILIIICLAFALGGLQRGPLAEGLAQATILLGVVLMIEWGSVWGSDLVRTMARRLPEKERLLVVDDEQCVHAARE